MAVDPALWIAKTGLVALLFLLSVVSFFLVFVFFFGFLCCVAAFQDLFYQNVRQGGGQTSQDTQLPSGMHLGTGVRVVATEKLFSQGNIVQSEIPLHVAVQGRGFLLVLMPGGTLGCNRDGSIQMNSQGQLVTASGYQLQPAFTIPDSAQSITIGTDGTVCVCLVGLCSLLL